MRATFLFLALLSATAAAQPADTVSVEATLPEVTVVATRLATLAEEAPSRVTLLSREAIDATGSRSVADLLEARSTLFVRRYGPAGLASVSFRGSGASQTLMLLDGHRIADPQLGQLDLSLLPAILLDRVEIMHGAASALHGTDGIAGVVDLRSLRPERTGTDIAGGVGAFGERSGSARATVARQSLRAVIAAEVMEAGGDFPFVDPASGELRRRAGADASLRSVFGRVETRLGPATANAAVWAGAADRGVPGSIGAPLTSRQEDRHLRAWGSVHAPLRGGSVRVGGLLQRGSIEYDGQLGRSSLASAEVELRAALGRWMGVSGFTAGVGTAEHPQLDDGAREARLGAFVAATGDFGRLIVYPAVRGDLYLRAENLGAVSPRLGLNWQPIEDLPLRLKLGAGSAFRAPTFNDRFWRYAGTDAGGDPALRPERGWTVDGGAFTELGPLRLEATLYRSWVRDQIVWRPATAGLFEPANVGRTHTAGVEGTVESDPQRVGRAILTAGLTYALTDARDVSDPASPAYGRQLRYVPRHQVKGHAGATVPLAASTRLRLDLHARHVSSRPVRVDGTLDQPPYFVGDAQVRLTHVLPTATISLTLGLENVLDADYAILRGYPMPPRHGRARLHLTF